MTAVALPLIEGLGPLLGGLGGLFGGSASNTAANAQAGLLKQEQQENAGEYSNMMQLFQQLSPFLEQYMKNGSPILNQVQAGANENLDQQFNSASATERQQINSQGYGSAPSGAAAGAEGDLAASRASAGTNTFLQNLLANEATKFQAAQGMQSAMQTMKPNQGMPAGAQPSSLPNALNQIGTGIGQVAGAMPNKSSAPSSGGPWTGALSTSDG